MPFNGVSWFFFTTAITYGEDVVTGLMSAVFFIYCAATWAMVGIIWFAQIVHYPLFSKVGPESFTGYQHANLRRTVLVVIPLQMVELATALVLVWKTPANLLPLQVWTNLVLIGITWVSTATLQVPSHNKLARGYQPKTQALLVSSNWIRTVIWSIRGVIAVWMLETALAF